MTKQLKFAVALLATIASMNLNAQKKAPAKSAKPTTEKAAAKPNKQETMDWIAGKMKENLAGNRVFLSYSNGEFVYRKQVGVYSCNTTIYLNRITGSSPEYSEDFFIKGSVISFSDCGKEYEFRNSSANNISIGVPNYNDYSDPFDFKNDNSLVERLKKAFAVLIEYNSSQKGAEKF